jgi:ribosome-associated toxin RatA of RatAB toxin-antitoxin module|tara:strand:+ start:410 stop:862 length:453 start_codon:yes stop_codon:yes gene_type:complete
MKFMSKLQFSVNLSATMNHLITLATDYEKFQQFLPDQLKSIRIIKKEINETITEEIIVFSSIIKNQIKQSTLHKQISDDVIISEILSGPAKGTIMKTAFVKIDSGTRVDVEIDMKLSLKARLLSPIIKKKYKTVLLGILYRMNGIALKMK